MSELHRRAVVLLGEHFTLQDIEVLLRYCQTRGYKMVGATRRLIGAIQMVQAGHADVVVAESREQVIGGRLEIISQEVQWLGWRGDPEYVGRPERPQRLRRGHRNAEG